MRRLTRYEMSSVDGEIYLDSSNTRLINAAEAWGLNEGDLFRCEPYMQLKMVNGSHSMWVPSVNDCLSNDWAIAKV